MSGTVDGGLKNVVVIGSTGTGKSSLCNILAGKSHDDDVFPVSAEMASCTNKTTGKTVEWRGRSGTRERPSAKKQGGNGLMTCGLL